MAKEKAHRAGERDGKSILTWTGAGGERERPKAVRVAETKENGLQTTAHVHVRPGCC